MKYERIRLSNRLEVETYPFSDFITCVEVYLDGESCSSFCSGHDIVDEWLDSPDLLLQLCEEHTTGRDQSSPSQSNRITVTQQVEVEMYSFSEDVYCINVYQDGQFKTSFCTDKVTMDEWQEDREVLASVVNSYLK